MVTSWLRALDMGCKAQAWLTPPSAALQTCAHALIALDSCRYPPVLVTTGTNDTRVEWWGPVKYAWRLRAHQQAPGNQILLSWTFEGHFSHDPNQVALEKTFLLQHLLPEAAGEVGDSKDVSSNGG